MVVNSVAFKKKHGVPESDGLSISEIAKLSKMPIKALQEVYNRGIGAFKTTGPSRPNIKSAEQWAYGRLYSFVMKTKTVYYGSDDDIRIKYKLV